MYAAGALVIDKDGKFCLFKKHTETGFALPMGKYDIKDANFLATAKREVQEETGVVFDLITDKYYYKHDGKMLCIVYLGRVKEIVECDKREGHTSFSDDPNLLLTGPYPEFNEDVLAFFDSEIKKELGRLK